MVFFFADSYAIMEYVAGNPLYERYFKNEKILTSRLNLMEVYYGALRVYGEEVAENAFSSLLSNCVDFNDEVLKAAMRFRLKERERKLSYVDAVGYQLSHYYGAKFLTSDRQFEKMPNVEWVK